MKDIDPDAKVEFTFRRKLILILFSAAFPLMVWGVMFWRLVVPSNGGFLPSHYHHYYVYQWIA